jgi:gliding motility-associated-like protein
MVPASGIICPGDSVMLTAEEGISYQWLGPIGQLLGTTQSIYTTEAGFYSCIVTDVEDCTLESNFLEVLTYSTPYLVTIPFADLCLTGSVDIAAVTHPSATVQWEAPISSNAPVVTITEPGIYTGTVTLCGISTTQSVTIIETEVNAFIETNGPPVICNGDSLQLIGNIGMSGYQWQPGQQITPNIWITEPGEYTLYTFDFQGCQGTSLPLVVTAGPEVILNPIESQYLCAQDSIFLGAESDLYQYVWAPNGETTAGIWVTEAGVYQLTATDENGCSSASELIEILPDTLPVLPPGEVLYHCSGDDFTYSLNTDIDFFWLVNDSSIVVNPFVINSLTSDTTLYYYALSENGCPTQLQSLSVQIISGNFLPEIYGETVVCAGDSILLYINDLPDSNFEWLVDGTFWSNNTDFEYLTNEASVPSINITLIAAVAGCSESEQTVPIQVLPLPNQLSILGNTNICLGDTAVLYTNVIDNSTAIWTWLGETFENDSIQIYFTNAQSILVQLTASLNGCTAQPNEEWLYVHPYPNLLSIVSNSPVCEYNTLSLDVIADNDANVFITTPNGLTSIGGNFQVNSAAASNTGFYQIVAETNFCSVSDSVWLQVFPAPIVQLGNDSIVCNGGTITYNLIGYENVIWNQSVVSDTYQASETGTVQVEVINEFGCPGNDEVYLQFEICDGELANIFSPNGDGINDNFYFNPFEFESFNFKLYNRWGKLLCEIIDKNYWDGVNCKNGLPVSDGTYFYVLEYVTKTKVPGIKKGYVQVIN